MAVILASTETMSYEEWLEYRKLGLGGSDASVVCGINKYKSPVELWMEKTNQLQAQEAGEAAYWGTQLEPFVREEFTKRTGIEVAKPAVILTETDAVEFSICSSWASSPKFIPSCWQIWTASVKSPALAPVSSRLRPPPPTKQGNGRTPSRMNICFRYSIVCPSRDTREPTSPS